MRLRIKKRLTRSKKYQKQSRLNLIKTG